MVVDENEIARAKVKVGLLIGSSKGFTLVEILIAIAVFVVVMTAVVSIFISGLRTRVEGVANLALEREGSVVLERIVRGLYGKEGLREADASAVTINPDGDTVWFSVDRNQYPTTTKTDDTTSLVYLLNGDIYYKPDTSSAEVECISGSAGNVESLQFAQTASRVAITIKLSSSLPGTTRRAFIHLTKSVTMRN